MGRKVFDVADAKKCDRCGDFYVEVEGSCFDSAIRALNQMCEYINNPQKVMKARNFISKIETHVDLCSKCSKSLKKWFFGRGDTDGIQKDTNKEVPQKPEKQAECPQG